MVFFIGSDRSISVFVGSCGPGVTSTTCEWSDWTMQGTDLILYYQSIFDRFGPINIGVCRLVRIRRGNYVLTIDEVPTTGGNMYGSKRSSVNKKYCPLQTLMVIYLFYRVLSTATITRSISAQRAVWVVNDLVRRNREYDGIWRQNGRKKCCFGEVTNSETGLDQCIHCPSFMVMLYTIFNQYYVQYIQPRVYQLTSAWVAGIHLVSANSYSVVKLPHCSVQRKKKSRVQREMTLNSFVSLQTSRWTHSSPGFGRTW